MGISHQVDNDLVEIEIAGECTLKELLSAFELMLVDERLPQRAHVLINVTVSETLPPLEGMEKIARALKGGKEKISGRVALLVAHEVRFGKARQLGAFLDSHGMVCQPFFERSQAITWLKGG